MRMFIARLCTCLIPDRKLRKRLRNKLSGKGNLTHYQQVHERYRIGRHSYISEEPDIVDPDTTIGKFCSIAKGVAIGTGLSLDHLELLREGTLNLSKERKVRL